MKTNFVPKRDRRGAVIATAWERPPWLLQGTKMLRRGDKFGFVYRINGISTASTPADTRVLLRDCETGEEDWVPFADVVEHYIQQAPKIA